MIKDEFKRQIKEKGEEGFSLIELLTVSIILLFTLAIMATIVAGVQLNYRVYREKAANRADAVSSLNLISRIIRNAGENVSTASLTPTANTRLRIKSDWTDTDNFLDDAFEDVEFYVSNNKLYMISYGATPNTIELAPNIESITFAYYDSTGGVTTDMTNAARVKVILAIAGESQPLIAIASIRNLIQPKEV